MAKFKDSTPEAVHAYSAAGPARHAQPTPHASAEDASTTVHDRSIGDILAQLRDLPTDSVERILAHQRQTGIRFGEAAVALGFASKNDVLFALSQQFHYPYSPEESRTVSRELVTLNEPFSARAEGFRALRSQVMMRLFQAGEPHRAIAIVSPDSGDGKTYCAANLAAALAQLGGRTLLVDADMRSPRLHEVFNLNNQYGLSGILSGRSNNQVIQQVVGVPSLFVLPVGTTPPNPQELVERPAFGLLMRELATKFDHVVVDTPAASRGADALVIATRCGSALIVSRKDAARVVALQDLVAMLSQSPAKVAGMIYNEY